RAPGPGDGPADAGAVAEAGGALRAAAEERARRADLERVRAEGEARQAQARAAEQRKRRRLLLVASGIIAVVLLAGLSVSLWQMQRALQAEAAANNHAEQARLNAGGGKRNAQQTVAPLRGQTAEGGERKFAQGTALTEDDRAFLRGIIAQYDAFAAIKGDDEDSRWVRAEGRLRVGIMRYRLSELQEAEKDYDQALSIYKQLAADFPSRPEFRQEL